MIHNRLRYVMDHEVLVFALRHLVETVSNWIFRSVFGSATSADDSNLTMDFIPEVLDFGAFDRLVRDDSKKRYWLALAKLMAREWFTRRWVVQEMALARKAIVHCCSRMISGYRRSFVWYILGRNCTPATFPGRIHV